MTARCDRRKLAIRIRETRALRSKVAPDMRPLFNHLTRLAVDSAKHGYCQRAGQELAHARRLAGKRWGGQLGRVKRRRRRR